MANSVTCRSRIEEDKKIKISVGSAGVIFRVGEGKSALLDKTILCDFEQAEAMMEIALSKIRRRKNG